MGTIRAFYQDTTAHAAVNLTVQRAADWFYLDADGTFKASPTTPLIALTAQAGLWAGSFRAIVAAAAIADGDYILHYHDPAATPPNALLDSEWTSVQGGSNATPAPGGGGGTIAFTTGAVLTASSPGRFTAALSPRAAAAPGAYVGRTLVFQGGAANDHRGTILSATISGSAGAYNADLTMDPTVEPAVAATPTAGDAFDIF